MRVFQHGAGGDGGGGDVPEPFTLFLIRHDIMALLVVCRQTGKTNRFSDNICDMMDHNKYSVLEVVLQFLARLCDPQAIRMIGNRRVSCTADD